MLYAYQRWLVFCFQILPDTYEVTVCEITAHERTRHTHSHITHSHSHIRHSHSHIRHTHSHIRHTHSHITHTHHHITHSHSHIRHTHSHITHTHTLTLHTTSLNAGSTHCVLTTSFLQVSSKVVKSQTQLGIHRTIARLIQCLIKYLHS